MNLFELKPHILYDEDGGSSASSTETEMSETDAAVEDLIGEPLENADEEEISEPSEETQESEPSEEAQSINRQEFEELQEKYKASSQEGIRQHQQLKALSEELERLKSKGAAVFGKEETPEPEKTEMPFDQSEYDRLYIDEGPAAAYAYAHNQIQERARNEQVTKTVKDEETQSEQFNRDMAMSRAKELLLKNANETKNDELINKYKDKNYIVTVDELQANKTVFEQWNKEAQYVIDYFRRLPIKVNGEIKSYKGKYPADAFKQAHRALNYDNDIEKTQIETAESTANLVAGSAPRVKSITPSGPATADIKVKFTGDESEYEARLKARQATDEQLDKELQERGLE